MVDKMRAIIIDDEERARNTLSQLVEQFCPEVIIEASLANVPDGVMAINKLKPHIVFLDIEMPEYNGFELLNFFRDVDFEIVFVTAYNEYAFKAFEVSAIDYLLKPVDIDKLKTAVTKVAQKLQQFDMQKRLDLLKESISTEQFNKIALPVADGLLFIDVPEIIYLEAEGAYTNVWLKNGSKILVSKKIKFFEEILDSRPNFFRSHRSYVVNINYLKKYNRAESSLTLENGKTVYVARDRKQDFEKQLKDNK
ncbi:MAG TPA: LytTR family DNA-binding domain-containing protein, partial [Flavobacteriales bacterium]|nr:LytTR family DNA-binding domain-containing protein [Flavobacteriales bacterium]